MKTRIFAYRGFVGIVAGDKFINNPTNPDELGCVVDIAEVEISMEAFEILSKLKKCGGSLGDIMCHECIGEHNPKACFSWLGGFHHIMPKDAEGDRDYKPLLLKPYITNVEVPDKFREAIGQA